jgi:hypothetical protein
MWVSIIAVSSNALASELSYKCRNEAKSALIYSATLSPVGVALAFAVSNTSNLNGAEKDLNQKTVTMPINMADEPSIEYVRYATQIKVNNSPIDHNYRNLVLRLKKEDLSKQTIRMILNISNLADKNDDGDFSSSYGMICTRVQ